VKTRGSKKNPKKSGAWAGNRRKGKFVEERDKSPGEPRQFMILWQNHKNQKVILPNVTVSSHPPKGFIKPKVFGMGGGGIRLW